MPGTALPPLAMTPEAARDQLDRAAFLLRDLANPVGRLTAFKTLSLRLRHAQLGGLLDDEVVLDLPGRLWQVAEAAGLIEETSGDTVMRALDLAFLEAERGPETTPKGNGAAAPSLDRIDLARYDTEEIPEREWGVRDRFPRRNVATLSGEGAVGKSIVLLQLAVAHVLGKDWLRSMPEPGPVVVVNCEDEGGELVRRLQPILAHCGARFADVANDLHLFSLADRDPLLAALDRGGRIVATPLYVELLKLVETVQPICIVVDNVADVFGGNEIDRAQVRQFVALMRRLAIAANGYVIMSAHPSLNGIATKSGLSGSTQWHNSVRARAYMHHQKTAENDSEATTGTRVLEFMKSNYSALAEQIELQWSNGLYLPVRVPSGPEQAAARAKADELFLTLLNRSAGKRENLSASRTANNYAPFVFAKTAEAKAAGIGRDEFMDALDRLIEAGKIAAEPYGPPKRGTVRIVRKGMP
ncbi:RecA-family ATPase [Bradyrhizobium japonicum]|uniref:AAA family ATPase n=1 Tax=Bradyrhizobium japonicum TaxID=375 RepID=UPI002169A370|nr:AAA family ATPase [Bradyrhizobium japonicum]MCS3496195.1 RecA-family ATPase [Bradyrhizobium japonicum]MCS3961642.1 RecA-family ATPase [Bradyrhizobium japonicum]MCS3993958.1 RecA-family ATPase [Bradyrhizobium japonicum]